MLFIASSILFYFLNLKINTVQQIVNNFGKYLFNEKPNFSLKKGTRMIQETYYKIIFHTWKLGGRMIREIACYMSIYGIHICNGMINNNNIIEGLFLH